MILEDSIVKVSDTSLTSQLNYWFEWDLMKLCRLFWCFSVVTVYTSIRVESGRRGQKSRKK